MSILNVNQIQPVGSGQTVTISAANITASSSTITANTFSGSLSSSGVSTFSDTVNVGAGKSIRLYGASSGYSDIIAAAGSASTTFTLPANGGSASQYLQTNGSGALSWATVTDTTGWTWDDTGTTASGTETVITGIPSTARQIIFLFQDISYNGSQDIFLRVGTSSGLVSSGYEVFSGYTDGAGGGAAAERTSAFQAYATGTASHNWNGKFVLTRLSANVWHGTVDITEDGGSSSWHWQRGIVDIGGTLERVAIISTSASTFDAGTVFCHYLEP